MIFTPIDAKTGLRIQLDILETYLPRGVAWEDYEFVEVTDTKTGKTYRVEGLDCSLPHCKCDAVIYDYDGQVVLADNF